MSVATDLNIIGVWARVREGLFQERWTAEVEKNGLYYLKCCNKNVADTGTGVMKFLRLHTWTSPRFLFPSDSISWAKFEK